MTLALSASSASSLVHLALGFLKLPFLAQHLGLDLLGFGKFRVVGGEHLLQVRKLPVALTQIIGQRQTGLLGFGFGDGRAFGAHLGSHLFVEGLAGLGEVILRLLKAGFATPKVSFLGREFRLELLAGRSDHGGRKRFRQLDLGAAVRAEDLRVGHGVGPVVMGRDCIRICSVARVGERRYPRQSCRSWQWRHPGRCCRFRLLGGIVRHG